MAIHGVAISVARVKIRWEQFMFTKFAAEPCTVDVEIFNWFQDIKIFASHFMAIHPVVAAIFYSYSYHPRNHKITCG